MHAFDILAEAKIRQWEKEKKEGKQDKRVQAQSESAYSGQSLERQLYDEIRELIRQAYSEGSGKQEMLLGEAEKLQVQLTARLETSGYHNMSKWFGDEIQRYKRENRKTWERAPEQA